MRRLILATGLLLCLSLSIQSSVAAAEVLPHWTEPMQTAGCADPAAVEAALVHGDYSIQFPFDAVEVALVCTLAPEPSILLIPFRGVPFACPIVIRGDFIPGGLETTKAIVDLTQFHALDGTELDLRGRGGLRSVLAIGDVEHETHLLCADGHWMAQDREGAAEHPTPDGSHGE